MENFDYSDIVLRFSGREDENKEQCSEIDYTDIVATHKENVEKMKNGLVEQEKQIDMVRSVLVNVLAKLKQTDTELKEANAKLKQKDAELGDANAKLAELEAELNRANAQLNKKEKELAEKDNELEAEKICQKKVEGTYYLTDEEKRERDEKFVKALNDLKVSYDNGYSAFRKLRETVIHNEYYEAIRGLAVVVNKQEYAHGKKQYVRELCGVLRAFGAEPIVPEVGGVVNPDEADAFAMDEAQNNELVVNTDPNATVKRVSARGWKLKGTSEGVLLVRATVIVDK